MKYFSMLIKPASSKCNINCKYCFYSDIANLRCIKDYGIMDKETSEILIKKTLGFFNEEANITFAFQGGEPTVAGLNYFKNFIEIVNKNKKNYHVINYAIQTNGMLINESWASFFKDNNFLVGISLDGFKENHDLVRVKGKSSPTFDTVMNSINLFKKHGVDFNILTVLTSRLSNNAKKLFEFYEENDFKYIQFIPCLPALEKKHDEFSLRPKEFYNFYNEYFKLWLEEFKKGNYISVTYFDNIIPLFVNHQPFQCGYLGYCSMQYVVEADGSVYPCDFYVLDKYKIGNIKEDSILDLYKSNITRDFINEDKTMSNKCKTCKYIRICNGQCKRVSVCFYDENYCGLQEFMQENEKEIMNVALSLR